MEGNELVNNCSLYIKTDTNWSMLFSFLKYALNK